MVVVEGLDDGRADLPGADQEDPHERVAYSGSRLAYSRWLPCRVRARARRRGARLRRRSRLGLAGRRSAPRAAFRRVVVARGLAAAGAGHGAAQRATRLYVVEQRGTIRVIERGKLRSGFFLDMRSASRRRRRAGSSRARLRSRSTRANRFIYVNYTDTNGDTRVVRYRTNGTRALPATRARAPRRRPAVLEPQRRRSRVRAGRLPLRRDSATADRAAIRRTARRTCSAAREDASPRRAPSRLAPGDRRRSACGTRGATRSTGSRATCTSATSARARSRRSTSRRARARGSRTTAGTCTRARAVRGQGARPGRARLPGLRVQPRPRLHGRRRVSSTAARRGRPSVGGTSSATTAAGSIWSLRGPRGKATGVRVEPFTIPRPDARSARTPPGSSTPTSHERDRSTA